MPRARARPARWVRWPCELWPDLVGPVLGVWRLRAPPRSEIYSHTHNFVDTASFSRSPPFKGCAETRLTHAQRTLSRRLASTRAVLRTEQPAALRAAECARACPGKLHGGTHHRAQARTRAAEDPRCVAHSTDWHTESTPCATSGRDARAPRGRAAEQRPRACSGASVRAHSGGGAPRTNGCVARTCGRPALSHTHTRTRTHAPGHIRVDAACAALYASTGGAAGDWQVPWLGVGDDNASLACGWWGVVCTSAPGEAPHVYALSLANNSLTGVLTFATGE